MLFKLDFNDENPLFCLSFHPTKPEFVVGLATGRVTYYHYDKQKGDPQQQWSTRRHKGSCRAIQFDQTGEFVVSCGSDNVVKKFESATGKVVVKAELRKEPSAIAVNEEYVVIGDDNGRVHGFKLADLKPVRSYDLENTESVSSICSLPVNRHSFAVGAEMRIARIDLRKDGVQSYSADQEDEIMCGCVASESRSAWGMSEGVLTIWNNRGLQDQQQRVKLVTDGSVESVLAAEIDNHAVAGTSDGYVSEVDLVSGQVITRALHSANEEVSYLDYDYEYRLVSGSISLLKVWATDEFQNEGKVLKRSKNSSKKQKTKKAKTDKDSPFADLL